MKHFLVVLGSGESGVGAAMLGKQKGYDVFVSDGGNIAARYKKELIDNGIEFEEGQHSAERILTATEVMKSPGIPEKNEMVKAIRAKGIPVISEIELAFRFKGESKIVAITGIPFARIAFTISFFSGIPGLFITSVAVRMRAAVCCPSSNSIPLSMSSFL